MSGGPELTYASYTRRINLGMEYLTTGLQFMIFASLLEQSFDGSVVEIEGCHSLWIHKGLLFLDNLLTGGYCEA